MYIVKLEHQATLRERYRYHSFYTKEEALKFAKSMSMNTYITIEVIES